MEERFARQMFPEWASVSAVKVLDEEPEAEPLPKRLGMSIKTEAFVKRYGFALGFILTMTVYSVLICAATGMIVHHNTVKEVTAELTAQHEAEMQDYINAEMGKRIVTGDESRSAAIRADAMEIAKVLYGVRSNSKTDLRTLVWCVLNRVDNKSYPNTVAEVVAQDQQWMGYSPDNPVTDDLFNIAYAEIDFWYGGIRPCSPDFVFMNWTPSEITLRDTFEYSSKTHSWRAES